MPNRQVNIKWNLEYRSKYLRVVHRLIDFENLVFGRLLESERAALKGRRRNFH